ncbi:hypothetical protein C7B69_10885 [filamentous cyanobacterium Phorm 46]|nr:hypothetical protein C7B69_10885 [filamentous cyanobacterium Phorm 46]
MFIFIYRTIGVSHRRRNRIFRENIEVVARIFGLKTGFLWLRCDRELLVKQDTDFIVKYLN